MNGRREQFPQGRRPDQPPAAAPGLRVLRRLLALLLVVALECLLLPGSPAVALSLGWPNRAPSGEPATTHRSIAPLQEVSPPEAVQQLQTALAGRQPVVEILSPQPGSVLAAGPWTLRLRVHDWPLVDGGALGMGPHLVVQLDQEPPRIWTTCEGVMPELAPGSHRLTVYAALPWGEARKDPGAVRQIQLHRTAPNPLALPVPGSPQLLAVSPAGPFSDQPLLLDWLLLNAPLQDVGGSGTQWRLRVTINGNDVLLDQQTPLWLRGWRWGLNALQLELLDFRGEPLNPPFNSLVQEVDLSAATPAPRWRGDRLSAAELAILLGEAQPASEAVRQPSMSAARSSSLDGGDAEGPVAGKPAAASGSSSPERDGVDETGLAYGVTATARSAIAAEDPLNSSSGQVPSEGASPPPRARSGGEPRALTGEFSTPSAASLAEADDSREQKPAAAARPLAVGAAKATSSAMPLELRATRSPGDGEQVEDTLPADTVDGDVRPADDLATSKPLLMIGSGARTTDSGATATGDERAAPSTPQPTMPVASVDTPPAASPPATDAADPRQSKAATMAAQPWDDGQERIQPTTLLTGRARDLVNPDGTLSRPERRGPLAALRERLER